ncbi:MAG: DUF1282 family protein [Bdellovibrionales bacterium]|nr:DUF1282 family protein [Bdellovibrionales bacterium]
MDPSSEQSSSSCGLCKCDFKTLINTLKEIVTNPKALFAGIKTSSETSKSLMSTYLFPLAVVSAILGTITWLNMGGGFLPSLTFSVVQALIMIVVVILSAKVLAMPQVASFIGGSYTETNVLHLFSLIWVPAIIGQVFSALIPGIGSLISFLLALYCLYLLYIGSKEGLGVNPIKFIIASIVITFLLSIIFGTIQTFLLGGPPMDPMAMLKHNAGLTDEQMKSLENLKNMANSMGAKTGN